MEACTWNMVGALLCHCSGPTRPFLCLQAPPCIFWTKMHGGLSVQKGLQQGLSFLLVLQFWEVSASAVKPHALWST